MTDNQSFWLSLISVLSAATTAGLSVFLLHKERTQTYRQEIYRRQLELIPILLSRAADFHLRVGALLNAASPDQYRENWASLREFYLQPSDITPEAMAFLPAQLFSAWQGLDSALTSLIGRAANERLDSDQLRIIEQHIAQCIALARDLMGVDALTRETQSLFPTAPPQMITRP